MSATGAFATIILERVLDVEQMVKGEDVFFSATGVADGDVLEIRFNV